MAITRTKIERREVLTCWARGRALSRNLLLLLRLQNEIVTLLKYVAKSLHYYMTERNRYSILGRGDTVKE